MTLVEFLLARVSEDEAVNADSGSLTSWHAVDCTIHPQGLEETWCDCDVPARVLAECEAKRRIVGLHSGGAGACIWTHSAPETHWEMDEPCPTLLALAAIYADHPDYREEWRP